MICFVSQVMKDTFPAGFKVKDTSVMFGDVKERKIIPKKEKVEGETLKLKMKDIVRETLEELGNPVSFAQIGQINSIERKRTFLADLNGV